MWLTLVQPLTLNMVLEKQQTQPLSTKQRVTPSTAGCNSDLFPNVKFTEIEQNGGYHMLGVWYLKKYTDQVKNSNSHH